LNGKVYHYRDKSGLECDAVVHLRNGQYGLIEVKLGGETLINEGVETLASLAKHKKRKNQCHGNKAWRRQRLNPLGASSK
ncbi:MAG: DUF4143 domain-containing protein, partial [Mediterranea sp.]|nr:DUF4143 domain-containing protein [Mediterranea sp.]